MVALTLPTAPYSWLSMPKYIAKHPLPLNNIDHINPTFNVYNSSGVENAENTGKKRVWRRLLDVQIKRTFNLTYYTQPHKALKPPFL